MVQTSSTNEIKDKNSTTKKGMADPLPSQHFYVCKFCMVVSSSSIVPNFQPIPNVLDEDDGGDDGSRIGSCGGSLQSLM